MQQKGKSVKIWDSTMQDIKLISKKKVWTNRVVVDQAVKGLKKSLGIKSGV